MGVVREIGESVTAVKSGDWVIPAGPGLGIEIMAAQSPNGCPALIQDILEVVTEKTITIIMYLYVCMVLHSIVAVQDCYSTYLVQVRGVAML